jgi:hypothetical protein
MLHNCLILQQKQKQIVPAEQRMNGLFTGFWSGEGGGFLIDPDADVVSKNFFACNERFG